MYKLVHIYCTSLRSVVVVSFARINVRSFLSAHIPVSYMFTVGPIILKF